MVAGVQRHFAKPVTAQALIDVHNEGLPEVPGPLPRLPQQLSEILVPSASGALRREWKPPPLVHLQRAT